MASSPVLRPEEMRFSLPHGLSMAAQRWGAPPLRDSDPDPASPGSHRLNVILAHGHMDNAGTWTRMAPRLLKHLEGARTPSGKPIRTTLVAVDLLGHGLSDHHPPGADYSRVRWAADLVRVADALGWEKFALFAHSAGGEACVNVAVAFPKRVAALVLIDIDGPAPRLARAIPLETISFLRRRLRPYTPKPFYRSVEGAAAARGAGNSIDGAIGIEAARILCARGLQEEVRDGVKGYTWRTDSALMGGRPGNPTPETALEFVKRIRCPTLLLAPKDGRVVKRNPPDSPHVAAFREAVGGNLAYVVVPGNHHAHLVDDVGAEACASEAGAFLAAMAETPPHRFVDRGKQRAERARSSL
ncbi:Alpha/Beta hydrolase protein [Hyaloraphidium curvatum]|nr:Alpha/Beta hydrolase protein [Hyaloraphidium curvatum]